MLRSIVLGAILACLIFGVAVAGENDLEKGSFDAYGYTADDVAVNNGIVAYWYAHGYANAFGGFPASWADVKAKGLPLRKFVSPHTGAEIDFDDGSLDFDGDMIYVPAECMDVEIHVQTTGGVVVLPGIVQGNSDLSVQFDPCYCDTCFINGCADITICGFDCWNCCGEKCICEITQWMMWKSFELHEVLYDTRPTDELAWVASGLNVVDMNYKEYAPFMDIEFIYKGKCCCILKKAYVHCCPPCDPCKPVCEPKCKLDCCTKPKCEDKCAPKCEDKCKPKCEPCKPKCEPCKPKCEPCKPKCEPKCKMNCCTKPKCESKCEPKCESKCKPKCESKCKPKCEPCKPKCEPCKPKCEPCKPKCEPKCKKSCCTKPKCEDKCSKC